MARKLHPFEGKRDVLIHPPPTSPLPSFPKPAAAVSLAREPRSSSDGKISPSVILLIVILAIIFFLCGILHLLVRYLMKRPGFTFFSRYETNPDSTGSVTIQRQLQQLFRLHDSGLDQSIIDALPVFCYKDIVGSKEPFDCAVCLCEFSDHDSLRLLPDCSHAFHINCIDTWLLSNSTCPLCRGTLVCAGSSFSNRLFSLDYFMEQNEGSSSQRKPTIMEEPAGERRVYSVRLGKFRSVYNEGVVETTQINQGEISSSNLDARRCFSLGSCQYVIADSDLLVSLDESSEAEIAMKIASTEVEDKRISNSNKGESFSISKIWQWSNKGKFSSSFHSGLSLNNGKPS